MTHLFGVIFGWKHVVCVINLVGCLDWQLVVEMCALEWGLMGKLGIREE